jgi:hypothetical protein
MLHTRFRGNRGKSHPYAKDGIKEETGDRELQGNVASGGTEDLVLSL